MFSVTTLHARASKEKDAPLEDTAEFQIVQVTGIVRLVGTGLFNDLIISGEYVWYIANADREKLHSLQQQKVTVEGEETIVEQKLLNNLPSIYRRELRNIKIISVNNEERISESP